MSRRKTRPSKVIVLTFLCLLLIGAVFRRWELILSGLGGLMTMFFGWLAFRNVVRCDVKKRSKPGYCTRPIKGALFGCGDHHWEKVLAWSRYIGMGYVARVLHTDLPILRWQDSAEQMRVRVTTSQLALQGIPTASGATTSEAIATEARHEPSARVQALNIYLGLASGVMTVIS